MIKLDDTPAPLAERFARFVLRAYPLLSGCGALATSRVARRVVADTPRIVWAKVAGRPCRVPLDDLVGRAADLFGDLAPKVTWALTRSVLPGDTVVDVGANLGVVLLRLANLVRPRGHVIAFEPAPTTLRLLKSTLGANPDINVRLHEVAVGAEDAELTLRIPGGNAGRATLEAMAPSEVKAEYPVAVRRLADLLAQDGVDRIAAMKMDIEGHEASALEGLFNVPKPLHPDVILFEGNSTSTDRVFALLEGQDYRLFGIPRRSYLTVRLAAKGTPRFLNSHDFLAVHRNARPDVLRNLGL